MKEYDLKKRTKEFAHRCVKLALEEADESVFWMEFAVAEKLINENRVNELLLEGKELTSIFIASRKTAKINQ